MFGSGPDNAAQKRSQHFRSFSLVLGKVLHRPALLRQDMLMTVACNWLMRCWQLKKDVHGFDAKRKQAG